MNKKLIALLMSGTMTTSMLAGCGGTAATSEITNVVATTESTTSSEATVLNATESVKIMNVFGEEEVELEYPEAPQRVVSLAGFATEMMLTLGLGDRIVDYAWQDNEVLPQYQEAFSKIEPLCPPAMDPGKVWLRNLIWFCPGLPGKRMITSTIRIWKRTVSMPTAFIVSVGLIDIWKMSTPIS